MKHPITYDEWLGCLDGELDPAAAGRVRGHIAACGECRATWEDLLEATAALRAAADEYAASYAIQPGNMRIRRERVLARIRSSGMPAPMEADAGDELTIRRLRHLQSVVAPVCGAQTAFHLIVGAAGQTPARQGWRSYMEQLADRTSALCGRSTARLVWQIGNSLP